MEKFILIKLTKMTYSKEVKNINNFEKTKVKKILIFRKCGWNRKCIREFKMHFKWIQKKRSFVMQTLETKWLFVKLLSSNPWHKFKLEPDILERISLGIYAPAFSHSLEPPVVSCTCLLLHDLLQSRVCRCFLADWVELSLFKLD